MFDIGWQELFLIGIVALVVIGPKDLPHVVRAVMRFSRRMRGIAGEFQATMAEVAREAELDDIKRKVQAAARMDPAAAAKAAVDPTGRLTADFDVDDFNRKLMEEIEAGPPKGPRPSAPPAVEPPSPPTDAPAASPSGTPATGAPATETSAAPTSEAEPAAAPDSDRDRQAHPERSS